jgi:hypothetical protein
MSRDIQYIGMDVHKKAIVIAVLNGSGTLVMESIVETKARSILQFIHGLRGELHVIWEEGTWAAWLYDLLKPHVHRVLVRSAAQCLIKGRQQERQDRCVQAGRLVAHGNAALGLSRGTRTADAARAGAQLSDYQPGSETSDESDQGSVSRLEHSLCGDPAWRRDASGGSSGLHRSNDTASGFIPTESHRPGTSMAPMDHERRSNESEINRDPAWPQRAVCGPRLDSAMATGSDQTASFTYT